jgi:dihydrofolate reductase
VSFDAVVAADLDWGIGKANALPWPRLPGDLAHFKRVTCEGGSVAVVMGRKTWQSAEVAERPLPKRLNIVITRGTLAVPDGVLVASSLDAALALAVPRVATTFCIGGAEIYRQAFDRGDLRWVYLTRIEDRFGCDATIPNLDALGFVRVAWEGEQQLEDAGVRYRIERLARSPS